MFFFISIISYVLFDDIFTRSFDDFISVKFLIAVFLPASPFIPTSPFINAPSLFIILVKMIIAPSLFIILVKICQPPHLFRPSLPFETQEY